MSNVYCGGAIIYNERLERILTIVAKKCRKEIQKQEILMLPYDYFDRCRTIQRAPKLWRVKYLSIDWPIGVVITYEDSFNVRHVYSVRSHALTRLIMQLSPYKLDSTPRNVRRVERAISKYEKRLMKDEFDIYGCEFTRHTYVPVVSHPLKRSNYENL